MNIIHLSWYTSAFETPQKCQSLQKTLSYIIICQIDCLLYVKLRAAFNPGSTMPFSGDIRSDVWYFYAHILINVFSLFSLEGELIIVGAEPE